MATRKNVDPRQTGLPIDLGPNSNADQTVSRLKHPLWTENKARLIERYLRYFVFITKHGTYIDCFAGPQEPDKPDMWAAKRVLELEPRRLRHFYFFEQDSDKISRLEAMRDMQSPKKKGESKRTIHINHGDCNHLVTELLVSKVIPQREATFCLLDQWTFQCHWSTVEAIASYKQRDNHKIELFYFLADAWFGRAEHATTKNRDVIERWWGRDDFHIFREKPREERAKIFADRFKTELGYAFSTPWPIYHAPGSTKVMYYMIHASDHSEAPKLMARAYNHAVEPLEPVEQLKLEFAQKSKT